MSGLHVIHIVESFATGTREVVRVLANQQVSEGLRVSIWYGVVSSTPIDPMIGLDPRVEILAVPGFGNRSFICLFRSYFWFLIRRKQTKSVIHLHSSIAGILGRAVRFRCSNPIVFTPHGFSLVRTDLSKFKRIMLTAMERLLDWITPSTIVACSQSEALVIHKYLPRARVEVVENGLLALHGSLVESHKGFQTPLRILSVGRICKQKNFEDLLYLKQHSKYELDVVVVGGGDTADILRLQSLGVEVAGWVAASEVAVYLNRADLFLQCSLWEGMPVSVIEAMSGGLPVIARDAVGTRDLVKHKVTGLIYHTAEELVATVAEVQNKRHDWSLMRKSAFELVRQNLTPQSMHRGYLRIYSEKYV